MRNRVGTVLFGVLLCLASTASQADLGPYSQDFEGLDQADPAALTNDGWLVFANVFNPDWSYAYGYGVFPAPNGGGGFSAVDAGQGDAPQGAQQLSIYNDYNNGDHGNGRFIEANVFQEQTVGAADVGSTWIFNFDAKRGNIEGGTTAFAFIKTIDPGAGFATTNFISVDMTGVPAAWTNASLSIVIDASLPGQLLQFGFSSVATGYEASGIFYDNVNFAAEVPPSLSAYSQDFEGLVQADPAALTDDGWLVFANVFNGDWSYAYGYGPFPAPNGGPGFSGIDIGKGGPQQGDQQLVTYSDYNNGDHGNGRFIEANVFQEQIVGAVDVGSTWVFEFDAKRGNIGGDTTALAFFKTLDPGAGFALTNFISVDMTDVSDEWDTYLLSIDIDPGLVGQILQFGFANMATAYQDSGMFYDNIQFAAPVCGDGAIGPGEQCDDGNTANGDMCDEFCQEEELLVVLEYFTASPAKRGVTLQWATEIELDTVGFRVLRGTGGREDKAVEFVSFVPASGNNLVGASYTFQDLEAPKGTLVYYLEDVDLFGRTYRHGPIVIDNTPSDRSRERTVGR